MDNYRRMPYLPTRAKAHRARKRAAVSPKKVRRVQFRDTVQNRVLAAAMRAFLKQQGIAVEQFMEDQP